MAAKRFTNSTEGGCLSTAERFTRGGGLTTAITVDSMANILYNYFESLEKYISNDVFQSNISSGPLICYFLTSDHGDSGFHTEVGEPRDFPPLDKVSPP